MTVLHGISLLLVSIVRISNYYFFEGNRVPYSEYYYDNLLPIQPVSD